VSLFQACLISNRRTAPDTCSWVGFFFTNKPWVAWPGREGAEEGSSAAGTGGKRERAEGSSNPTIARSGSDES